jgi:hypothetical protein
MTSNENRLPGVTESQRRQNEDEIASQELREEVWNEP